MQNHNQTTFSYTANTLHHAYKSQRNTLLPLLKKTKDKAALKKIHLALLSIDLSIQIFNDANRQFPLINNEILREGKQNITLISHRESTAKTLKKSIATLNSLDSIIFEKKMHYSLELSENRGENIPIQIASNILKESAFLFTHVLHTLYENKDTQKTSQTITAHLEYILGLNIIEPISSGKTFYKEILKERRKYANSKDKKDKLETFIFNAHHFSLATLLFIKHWIGYKEYTLEDAQKELNTKINDILHQRKSKPISK